MILGLDKYYTKYLLMHKQVIYLHFSGLFCSRPLINFEIICLPFIEFKSNNYVPKKLRQFV